MKKLVKKLFSLSLTKKQQDLIAFRLRKNKALISGQNNSIRYSDAQLANTSIQIDGNNNEIIFGPGSVIRNIEIRMHGSNHKLLIGRNCKINGGEIVFNDKKGTIYIGDETFINRANFYCRESSPIYLGPQCMLAWDIEIYSGDSHPIYEIESDRRVNPAEEVSIGSKVWIGSHVQILKGVSIGNCSVIGTRSVVTRNISSHCIAAGIPAAVVRKGTYWKESPHHDKPGILGNEISPSLTITDGIDIYAYKHEINKHGRN